MNNETPGAAPKTPWIWTTRTLVIALLMVGPLALPLLWFNKRIAMTQKILWTVVLASLTYYTAVYTAGLFEKTLAQYRELGLIQ